MASEIRTVGKHTLVYGAGIVLGKLASFLMLPIYTHYLTPSDYGVLELLAMMIDVVGMLVGLGFMTGLYKFYSEAEGHDKVAVVGTAALGSAVLAAVGTILGIAGAPLLNRLIIGQAGSPLYVQIFFLVYFMQTIGSVPLALLRAQNRSVIFVAVNTAKLLMSLSLNILLVVYLHKGVLGVMISSIVTETVMAIGLGGYLLYDVGLAFSRRYAKALFDFGRPMVLWSLGMFVLVFSDRFFLKQYSGMTQVGIYSLAYQFAFVLSGLAFTPFMAVWDPRRFEIAKRPDADDIFARVFVYLNIVIGVGGAGVVLFVHDFLRLMSAPEFWSAAAVVPLLIASQIVFIAAAFCNLGLLLAGETRVLGKVSIWLTGVTLALNFALIPFLGMWGAAIATFLAYTLRFVLIYAAAQKVHRIGYNWAPITKLYTVLVVLSGLGVAGWLLPLAASIPLSVALFAAAVHLTYARVLEPWERAAVREAVAQGVSRIRLELARMGSARLAGRA